MVKCHREKCVKHGSFNFPGEKKVLYCGNHSLPGMIDVYHSFCKHIGCKIQPTYNKPTEKIGIYCREHKLKGMIDVKSRHCIYENCRKQSSYNKIGEKMGLYCNDHKLDGMVDVKHKKCCYDGCQRRPNFNKVGESIGLYCSKHKLDGMICVTVKKCKYTGCTIMPTYNFSGTTKGIYCKEHKLDGMIDVRNRNKLCKYRGCKTRASFNIIGETKGIYCQKHKSDEMIIVTVKLCQYNGCTILPTFNNIGEKKGLYCAKHALKDMIAVTHIKCQHIDCYKRAYFGLVGYGPILCPKHKNDVKHTVFEPNKKCNECDDYAVCGNKYRIHCEKHKEDNELNLIERPCKKCGFDNLLDKDDTCRLCNPQSFQKYRLAKQNLVKSILENNLDDNLKFLESCDKIIDYGLCGKERPDFLFDCKDHYVVLECDENQHKERLCECEFSRMINVSQSLGMHTIFIRYNPDEFINKNGKLINPSLTIRKELLIKMMNYQISRQDFQFLEAIYMFYDGCDETYISSKVLLEDENYVYKHMSDDISKNIKQHVITINKLDDIYNKFAGSFNETIRKVKKI